MHNLINNNLTIILASLFFINIFFLYFFYIFRKKIKLVDVPNERKTHTGEVPLVGGISIYSTFILFFLFVETNNAHKIIFITSFIVFFISLYDDKFIMGITERIFSNITCLIIVGLVLRYLILVTILLHSFRRF